MNYIIFDLEWNQNPNGKRQQKSRLLFEIIEIGAIKMDEQKRTIDTFHRLIKPQVYRWIHDSIHEVIHVNYKDLLNGTPFVQAVKEFLEWCGEDYVFFTWGTQDVGELQRNMKYYGLLGMLPGPVIYYDVQKLFSIQYEDRKTRRALEYAIGQLGLEKSMKFHRALSDAYYTAEILKRLDDSCIWPNSSIDVYQNPKTKKEEIHISYPTYDKYISREFSVREKVMKDREVASTRCPICRHPAKRKIRWFSNNSKIYYSISICQEHGYVKGKVRIRKTEEEMYYAVKTIKLVNIEEAEEIHEKRDSLRYKRLMKRKSEKEI